MRINVKRRDEYYWDLPILKYDQDLHDNVESEPQSDCWQSTKTLGIAYTVTDIVEA